MKIGFFDSGLGGLTILKAVAKQLPEYDYEFYGDTANLPYGSKSEEAIFALTKQGVEHLFARGCALVIIACNTASAQTLRKLQDGFLAENYPDRRILGVIIPAVEEVAKAHLKKVGLIATRRTVESKKFNLELALYAPMTELISIATPALVPLIEGGKTKEALREVFSRLKREDWSETEGLILGCTHYTLLKDQLRQHDWKRPFVIFSQDEIIPQKLATYLENHPEIAEKLSHRGTRNIYLTDKNQRYDAVIKELLGGVYL